MKIFFHINPNDLTTTLQQNPVLSRFNFVIEKVTTFPGAVMEVIRMV